jgi:FkbM family methyltransferase
MNLEEKRRKFLEYLERKAPEKVIKSFEKNTGPGFIKKILRLIKAPSLYIPLILQSKIPWFLFRSKEKKSKFFNSREVIFPLNDPSPASISIFGFIPLVDDIKLTKFLIKNLKENDIFYDIGANYGFYTYLALEFCKEVHSFEPIPDVFGYLYKNLNNEPKAILNNIALSDKIGDALMYINKISTGGSTIIKEVFQKNPNNFLKEIKVPIRTLDDYLKNHNKPTIIKIDVEGAESKVIEGGINFFTRNSPIIIMEVWRDAKIFL